MSLYSFVLLINYMSGMIFHDFHVSVTNIDHDRESQSLEITQRIFLDDLEAQLLLLEEGKKYDIKGTEDFTSLNPLIEWYVAEQMNLWVNEKPVDLSYLGSKVEGDIIMCFIEVTKVKKVKSLKIQNTTLLGLFPDQINLVHVKTANGSKSLKMSVDESVQELSFQ